MKKTILITLLGVSLALVGCTKQTPVENQNVNQSTANINQNTNNIQPEPVAQEPAEATPSSTPNEEPKEAAATTNCNTFPDKLSTCTKYKCQFVHPLTRGTMQKEITGIIGGKCNYIEEMPNNGKMECNYTQSQRTVAAQYYKDVAAAETTGTNLHVDLGSGEQKTTYTIDGKEVENPLNTFLNDGTCIISGY